MLVLTTILKNAQAVFMKCALANIVVAKRHLLEM